MPQGGRQIWDIVARVATTIVVALGALGLAGWFLNLEALVNIAPGLATMKVNTAICMLICGVLLWLQIGLPGAGRSVVHQSFAVLVAIISVLTLAEYAFRIDLHIDQLLWTDTITPIGQLPGRMAAITAVNYILAAAALLAAPHRSRVANGAFVCATAAGVTLSFLAVLGYLYGAAPLYQPLAPVSIAVNTTLAFLALFLGLMALREDLGWVALIRSTGAGGALVRWLLPVVVALPPIVGWLRLHGQELGFFDLRVGVSLFSAANVILVASVLYIAARHVDRLDAQRSLGEARMRESEEKYRSTFDIAPVGITHLSLNGDFLMVNDFFCQMVGYGRRELLSLNLMALTPPEDVAGLRARLHLARTAVVPAEKFTKKYLHKDGRPIWCEVVISAAHDDAYQPTHLISIITDISARMEAEAHQRHLSVQLQQSQKMEAIGQLTGGMAHDFNNLLAVVLGNLDFLEERFAPGSEELELTQAAIEGATQGAELIRRLLAFARRQPLAPKLSDIGPVLEAAAQLFRRTLGESITLEVKLADGLWPVLVDVAQLESSLLNLAVNARDAMPDGGVIIIEAENVTLDGGAVVFNPEAVAGDYLMISLSDTGSGMKPEIISRVFEPFFTTKGGRGTGLGLSMVHGFVKQSGGHTRIYSELGRGTTISIYLPRATHIAEEEYDTKVTGELATGDEVLLVVEDNLKLRDVAMRRLQDLGYRTIPASNGAEALAIVKAGVAFDLMFTDVIMPGGMDGKALAEAARSLRPDLKVLFTSGFTGAAASAAMMTEKFGSNLLTKPYRKEDLARYVRNALDG
jgi:PAS domain S-box-containing protein